MPLTFEAFYVGLTQVRSSANIRFLPLKRFNPIEEIENRSYSKTMVYQLCSIPQPFIP